MSPRSGGGDPPAEAALSRRVLEELRAVGGEALVRDLMAVFAERTPDRLRSAAEALAAGDLEATAAAVHSLRSAAGTVGAGQLVELAGRAEGAARAGRVEELGAQLEELRRESQVVLTEARRLARQGATNE